VPLQSCQRAVERLHVFQRHRSAWDGRPVWTTCSTRKNLDNGGQWPAGPTALSLAAPFYRRKKLMVGIDRPVSKDGRQRMSCTHGGGHQAVRQVGNRTGKWRRNTAVRADRVPFFIGGKNSRRAKLAGWSSRACAGQVASETSSTRAECIRNRCRPFLARRAPASSHAPFA
jgi:hypothetical protein